jgi:PAS domain S-box-containing protein
MMLQSVATGMLIALLGILAISQVQLHNANAAAQRGLETVTRLQRTGIALEYEGREAKAAATGGMAAVLLKDEIGAALAACQAVMEPGGGALRKLLAENASLAASLGNRCMTLSAAEARRAAEGFRFETVAALPDLHTLEDALQHGINLRMQAVLEAAPNRRAREASARQWQATVLVACLIAGLGASVLQLGLLHQLSHEHSALAAEMVRRMEAEAQSRAYLEVAPAAILGIDRTGRIALVNSRALSAFGFASAELLGQTVEILAPERDRSRQGDLFRRYVRETGEPRGVAELELTARRKDGGEFPAEVRVSAIDSTAGKLVLVSVTDISQHKKSEEELRRAVRELESFAHSVSHDLRRPLQIIVGFSELLEANHAQALGNDGQEHIQRILSAGVHMSELIESLLSLAKVSTGPLSRTRVALGDVANLVVEDLQCSEPGRTVTITTQPGLEVEGDPRLLRILLENLLGNAWKFTGKTAAAEIELGAQRHHGATVYFVKDNGAGFDMKKADDLFKAFHRLHEAGDFPGSGIGLATVQRIVHRHGGRIWAKSEPNRGATFCFTLEPVSDQQFKTVAA